ncbi:hypothetical protein BH683_016360 [Williamsia sp. 1138]|uniref:hypothetical protein n=1 Tax=Williamsia sp. 1138 TaxID=1903117 RepID=UPI000A114203|nr:hypothetical protein [Williamsia sp. 1138]OZG27868.1 hypothetical protein BH683_016360 [Williamsia sp. 1138]
MINLYAVDALERCETLPDEVSAERIHRTYVREAAYPYVEENLRALRTRGGMRDRKLEDALENVLSRNALQHRLLKYRWLVLDVGPRLPRSLLRLGKFHLQGRWNG